MTGFIKNQKKLIDDSIIKELIPSDVKIRDELYNKISKHYIRNRKVTPEGKIKIKYIVELINFYGYNSEKIDIEIPAGRIGRKAEIPGRDTVFADIVVYRDNARNMPFIVVEGKAEGEKGGEKQAESYTRNLGAEYHILTDGIIKKYFKTSRYPEKSLSIGNIPIWVGSKPLVEKIPKTMQLPAFKDEHELRKIVHQCHELILEQQGHDPATAFDELTNLLFLKLYDEREIPSFYEFVVLENEEPRDVGNKIRDIFENGVKSSKYKDVFYSKFNRTVDVKISLDDFTIYKIVQLLQGYSLVNTTENIKGADIKGTVYEQMVGNTFRGELAQFFTPREIVEFIVRILKPKKEHKLVDNACGSGGFLIMTLNYLKEELRKKFPNLSDGEIKSLIKYFAEHNVFGVDKNERMTRVAKMNMIMHGDGHSGIVNACGTLTDKDLPDWFLRDLKEGTIDMVMSNPPFAGRFKDEKMLELFDLGKNKKTGKTRSVSKEVLFIEKIIKLLKTEKGKEGKVGMVLPAGIFNNPSMEDVRDYIRENTKIIALIGLPHLAFQVTGANNEGNLLFFERCEKPPEDYDIFIDWAGFVGFDTTGRKIIQNELRDMVDRFEKPPKTNIIKFSQLEDRIDPWYYHPNYKKIKNKIKKIGYPLKPLTDICILSNDILDKKRHSNDVFDYIETNNVDLDVGKIISSIQITGKTAPNRARYILKENDILIPNARDCMRGVAIVPKEFEGYIATNRFLVVRPNPDEVLLRYLYYMLLQPEILSLLKQQATGEINPGVSWNYLKSRKLPKIPVPSKTKQQDIIEKIKQYEIQKEKLLNDLESTNEKIDEVIRAGITAKIQRNKIRKLGSEYIGGLF